jgi:exodeoxyribonuclease VII small subunit
MAKKEFSFSDAMVEIDKILKEIENGNLNIDKLSGEVKQASELIRQCQKKLRTTEEEVNNIFKDLI